MGVPFSFLHVWTYVMGISLLGRVLCQTFPILTIHPMPLSRIFHDDLMSDLTMALSELHPVFLHATPEQGFSQARFIKTATSSRPTNSSPQQRDGRQPSTNTFPGSKMQAIKMSHDFKTHSTHPFPNRDSQNTGPSNPRLTYGFEPHVSKTKQISSKYDSGSLQRNNHLQKSKKPQFPDPKLSYEIRSSQDRGQQAYEHRNQGTSHIRAEMKNKPIPTAKHPQFHYYNKNQWFVPAPSDNKKLNNSARSTAANKFSDSQHNIERGQESVRRPVTSFDNQQVSFNNDRREFRSNKEPHQGFQSSQKDPSNFNIHSYRNSQPQLQSVKIALKVHESEGSSVLSLEDINRSLKNQPIVFRPNTDTNVHSSEAEKKTYLLFKAPVLVTTKRPSSAPFTASGFFRNAPQGAPRQQTNHHQSQFSVQIPTVPQNEKPRTIGMNSMNDDYSRDSSTPISRNYSYSLNKQHQSIHVENRSPYQSFVENSGKNLHYKEDPYAAVTEVYSQPQSESIPGVIKQNHGNVSSYPISSSSSASYAVHQSNNHKPQLKKTTLKKAVLKKKSKLVEEDEVQDDHSIPGSPGADYPTYDEIPLTNFNCKEFNMPGFYADLDTDCQVFHNCDTELQKHSFLCPNGTVFRQELFICDWWYNVRCEDSPDHFPLNDGLYLHP